MSRLRLYDQPVGESAENLRFMEIIDKQFLETPWYGSRQMARYTKRNNHQCGRHRVRRLMRLIRLVPIHCLTGYRMAMHERGSRAKHEQETPATQNLAVLAEKRDHRPPEPGSGAQISPISPCDVAFCISWRSWIGTAARFWRGGYQTAWMRTSAALCIKRTKRGVSDD